MSIFDDRQRSAADRPRAQVVVAVRLPGRARWRQWQHRRRRGRERATPPGAGDAARAGTVLTVVLVGIAVIVAFVILKFLSTGALIEGVKRARGNGAMTVREGFREGWAHWGVLLRLALLFFAANAASVLVLVGACVSRRPGVRPPGVVRRRRSGRRRRRAVARDAVHVAGIRRAHRRARKSPRAGRDPQGAPVLARPVAARAEAPRRGLCRRAGRRRGGLPRDSSARSARPGIGAPVGRPPLRSAC